MEPFALPCSAGAVPKPDWVGRSIQAQLNWLPGDVLQLITSVSPLSTSQSIVGLLIVDTLCGQQVIDPGPLNLGNLLWDLAGAAVPNPNGSPGTLGWWIGQKLAYYAFSQVCQCVGTGLPPPLPIVPTPPSGAAPYPTDPEAQPQLTRIEHNQATSSDGLTTIYNGMQLGITEMRDLAFRSRSSFVGRAGMPSWTMSGEGQQTLHGYDQVGGGGTQDVYAILVDLTAIPPTVKRRGAVYQRLYGVGSIEWNVEVQSGSPHIIAHRDSIHYEHQLIHAPQHAMTWTVRWRLQPGVEAIAYQLERSPDSAIYAPLGPYPGAYQRFDTWNAPDGWTDSPFYPKAAEIRELPPGGGLPPADFPCCG